MFEEAQRPLDPCQGRFERSTPLSRRLDGIARVAQQLERVPEVLARCFERLTPCPPLEGASTPVQRTSSLRAAPAVDDAAPLE
ncbi:MAG: hypothetical protein AUH46_01835 [Gemmatimonadetes bacterium 13_1_40CM_70_15]|nr:MAG: hypothetical protein AUH46_01835 [Gemmatimonadetes bacterium 13_1_40CM_70_15]